MSAPVDPAQALYAEALRLQEPMKAALAKGDSVIQEWYAGKTAFITGGSGYLGKLLIEKLIRSCKLTRIYVLIREKKGKSVQDRLDELIKDPLFNFLREEQPYFANILRGVQGDVAELRLGINTSERQTLVQEVDIIFHLAATTRFDETLKRATFINIRGTRELLLFAKECRQLKSMVHVSTAYTHATHDMIDKEISEKFYPSPISPNALIKLVETTDEPRLHAITKDLIMGWPNTYTFTKAVSEELVRTTAGELPICVFRPAIVFCPYYEPDPGYVDYSCAYGPAGIVLGVGIGAMRVLFTKRKVRLCFVPADFTTNAAIACGWNTAIAMRGSHPTPDLKIYTLSSSKCNIGFYVISDVLKTTGRTIVTPKSIWYNFLIETDNMVYYKACVCILHYFPAYVADAVCKLFNIQLPKGLTSFVKIYTKMEKMTSVYSYYLTKEWYMRDDNLEALYESLPSTDKDLFCFDVTKTDWNKFILFWALGIRRHLMKDDLKDTAYAVKKQKWLKLFNYALLLLFIYTVWSLIKFAISWLV